MLSIRIRAGQDHKEDKMSLSSDLIATAFSYKIFGSLFLKY